MDQIDQHLNRILNQATELRKDIRELDTSQQLATLRRLALMLQHLYDITESVYTIQLLRR